MANWNLPTVTTDYLQVLSALNEKIENSAKLDYDGDTNLPDGAMRVDPSSGLIQRWDGSSFATVVLSSSSIPNLAASKITSGSLADARIPSLNASKVNSGVFSIDRIPSINASKHGNLSGGNLHSNATSSVSGFMSAADKQKLDSISGAGGPVEFSFRSSNISVSSTSGQSVGLGDGFSIVDGSTYLLKFFLYLTGVNSAGFVFGASGASSLVSVSSGVSLFTAGSSVEPVNSFLESDITGFDYDETDFSSSSLRISGEITFLASGDGDLNFEMSKKVSAATLTLVAGSSMSLYLLG